ncbi:MAG: PhnD/SsuA/transferrin family substrate-binding protein [Phycisphaerae bacterium]|nr:PhnD/SsuA/transferrin family substrate-binding protein [Phycisphaerae bacterium]
MSAKRSYFASVVLVVVTVTLIGACGCTQGSSSKIVVGIKSSDPAGAREQYAPFVKLMSENTGQPVALKVCKDADALCRASAAGEIGFVIVSPTDYVAMKNTAALEAVATKLNKSGTPYCQGTLIASKGKGVKGIGDLKGKRFRYGPKGSFNKNLAALAAFKQAGLKPGDLAGVSYGSGCGGIAQTVLDGQADAGVICDYSWDGWVAKKDAKIGKLAVIARGPKLRDTVVAAAGGTDAATREQFVGALLALKNNPTILKPPLKARGFARSTDGDYDSLRAVIESLGL